MSFQPLHNFATGDDVESMSSASNNQLTRPEPPNPRRKAEARRKTLLATSLFTLIVFIASILGYGIFSLNIPSTFETEQVSATGFSSNDNRMSTYAAQSGPTNGQSNVPKDTSSTPPPLNPAPGGTGEKTSGQVSQEIENAEADGIRFRSYEGHKHEGVFPSRTKRSRNSSRRRGPPTLPPNPTERHPVSLLYDMRLNPKFEFFVCPANIQHFKTALTIVLQDTKTYYGYGIGKRNSKRLAAQVAATDIYKLNYTDMPDEITRNEMAANCSLTGGSIATGEA